MARYGMDYDRGFRGHGQGQPRGGRWFRGLWDGDVRHDEIGGRMFDTGGPDRGYDRMQGYHGGPFNRYDRGFGGQGSAGYRTGGAGHGYGGTGGDWGREPSWGVQRVNRGGFGGGNPGWHARGGGYERDPGDPMRQGWQQLRGGAGNPLHRDRGYDRGW